MDIAAELEKLENERSFILGWLDHPVTRELLADHEEQLSVSDSPLLDDDLLSMEDAFKTAALKGFRRGARRWKLFVEEKLEKLEVAIQDLQAQLDQE